MFHLLIEKYDKQVEHNELLFGQLTSTVINWGFCRPQNPTKASDFMPSEWVKQQQEPIKKTHKVDYKKLDRQIDNVFGAIYKGQQESLKHVNGGVQGVMPVGNK